LFRRSSLSNPGDRAALLAHPEALELAGTAVSEGRTRVACTADGMIVGFITGRPLGSGALEVEDLFVDPDWMGRGVGRALVLDAVATARAEGLPRINVTANTHALAFYQRMGFVIDGQTETQFGRAHRMHIPVGIPEYRA
jgi:GNAT superfamily N-acetyltransferase